MNPSDGILVCAPNPCYNGGTCALMNGGTDYYCYCRPDLPLTGKNCDQRITTVATTTTTAPSPCASSPCINSGTCTENRFLNTYTCTCPDYAYGNRCESRCPIDMYEIHALQFRRSFSDINQCYTSPPCQNGGTCLPRPNNGFQCQCPSPYTGTYCEQRVQPTSMLSSCSMTAK